MTNIICKAILLVIGCVCLILGLMAFYVAIFGQTGLHDSLLCMFFGTCLFLLIKLDVLIYTSIPNSQSKN